jgi:hypothetical protein
MQFGCIGVKRLTAKASLVALPFFERMGFVIAEEQYVTVGGASFRRYAMREAINA